MNLLAQFSEFLEKQDALSKLSEHEKLHEYGYSEIHVIASIGELAEPNVTAIAIALQMSKGAISKITKKLMKAGILTSYEVADNKQKVFFKLSEKGEFLCEEHRKRHELWMLRDQQFLDQFSEAQQLQIMSFMESYNAYLEEKIEELGGT